MKKFGFNSVLKKPLGKTGFEAMLKSVSKWFLEEINIIPFKNQDLIYIKILNIKKILVGFLILEEN